jgi:glycosyltransferase involved in cell wall biosynthesis
MKKSVSEIAKSLFGTRASINNQRNELERTNPHSVAMASFFNSGLFDAAWYLETYPDLKSAKVRAQDHYFQSGWREGRMPNSVFDTSWYLQKYKEVAAAGINPLFHYWAYGEKENRQPCSYFDTEWYKATYGSEAKNGALAHFLMNRASLQFSPNRNFDISYYLANNPDVAAANIDPFEHYIKTGYREGRSPAAHFDTTFYVRNCMYGDPRDPLSHYMEVGRFADAPTHPSQARPNAASEIKRYSKPGSLFEDLERLRVAPSQSGPKVIAFHLPQFHSIPENDRWWSLGFTEWTNVARGTPRFEGHYQPRIPQQLGFYDLSQPASLKKQIELARGAGLFGFCFYYYNFNGRRILERPIENFLSETDLDFPFCIMWANENWTRRWDGADAEILLKQNYQPSDTDEVVDDLARHFSDPRYIRVNNRPLFILYRPDVIPNVKEKLERWRCRFKDEHDLDPLILMVQAFGNVDPIEFGFDGAIEFPPHKLATNLPATNSERRYFDATATAPVYSYDDLVRASLNESTPNFPLIKTAVPSWDNDARRQGHGLVLADSTPEKYENWLRSLIANSVKNTLHGSSFVFVNAWNEWAEGAYLEPDVHFGAAYLNATARAISGTSSANARMKLLLLGHDAHPHGAQLLLLNLARTMVRQFGIEVEIVLRSGGEMLQDYDAVAPTSVCATAAQFEQKLSDLVHRGFQLAISNTVATGGFLPQLKSFGIRTLSLIHELPRIIEEKSLREQASSIAQHSDIVVFPAERVKRDFEKSISAVKGKCRVRPQGIYNEVKWIAGARESIRSELELPTDAKIVLNVGYADLRKGIDIFCSLSQILAAADPSIYCVWVGNLDPSAKHWFEDSGAYPNVKFVGQRSDVDRYLSAADLFALTSREDPYPSVVLEALSVRLPVVGFASAGGFEELLSNKEFGQLVAFGDVQAFADVVLTSLQKNDLGSVSEDKRIVEFKKRFAFDEYAFWLASQLNGQLKKLSVVVPNYNYERYLRDRLSSIAEQTYPIFETIVLDDASTDNSVEVVRRFCEEFGRDVRLVENSENSGNVFAQWRRGIDKARGDLVWIAEADDLSAAPFLSKLVPHFEGEQTSFAYCDSSPIDSDGNILEESYKPYYAKVAPDALQSDFECEGTAFAQRYLSQRNVILNVSSVVWRKSCLNRSFDLVRNNLLTFKLAGDWLLYLAACVDGHVSYTSKPMNYHRRHQQGVTSRSPAELQLNEVSRIHDFFAKHFGVDDDMRQHQLKYMNELTEQFAELRTTDIR